MKIETRTIYIAEDGEEFDSKSECEKYEADGCVVMRKIPSYCDKYALTPENEYALGFCQQGDGIFYWATATKYAPSYDGPKPKWATHFIYFSK
jgi:hypothetical protein